MLPSRNLIKGAKALLLGLGLLAVMATLVPFLEVEHWVVRSFDYPILLLAVLSFTVILLYFPLFDCRSTLDRVAVLLLCGSLLFQLNKIFPYTGYSGKEVLDASKVAPQSMSVYTANVLQGNDDISSLSKDTKHYGADILLFTETNRKWKNWLDAVFGNGYPFRVQVPQENTYGMLLYSKFELKDSSVEFMVEDSIPSIHTKVILPSKKSIQLYAIHPAPPTPLHNPKTLDRDAELIKIGRLAKESHLPVIVMGDFNDVAWSKTTALFQSYSGLLDLRKGRGMFNTYNAKYWFIRWPLDHVFVSPEFTVVDIELGRRVGSDHFPFFTKLSLEPEIAPNQDLPEPKGETMKRAKEQLKEELKDDREEDH